MPDAPSDTAGDRALARRAMALLDLTDLNDQCTETAVMQLCAKAQGGPVKTAAVCIWPQFVSLARRQLDGSGVAVATVVNFPAGGTNVARIYDDTREAIDDGAVPAAAVDAMLAHDLPGPLLNTFDHGGYLIWRTWPVWTRPMCVASTPARASACGLRPRTWCSSTGGTTTCRAWSTWRAIWSRCTRKD